MRKVLLCLPVAALVALVAGGATRAPTPAPRDGGTATVTAPAGEAPFESFAPPADAFDKRSAIDLRFLNERQAGQHGFVTARDGRFFLGDGRPVRFWGVNGPATRGAALRGEARQLAKYGVNLVRAQLEPWDERGDPAPDKARAAAEVVETLKGEGIYSHLSVFFPLAFRPPANRDGFAGYDGTRSAMAAVFFNPALQALHRAWLKTLLLTPGRNGKRLVDEPAVFGLELVNEDSLLFWTFGPDVVPDAQLRSFERQFGDWLAARHGSLAKAVARWKGVGTARDDLAAGRVGFPPFADMASARGVRDQDTIRFLVETEQRFYADSIAFLRALGFRGLVIASNWQTASAERFGPLLKYIYTAGDFVDRHGYFGSGNQGEAATWSLRTGHTYLERSALRFEREEASGPPAFAHPIMELQAGDKPTTISELGWTRPNRHRSEAPLFLATYGALQDTDAVVQFQKDGAGFSAKPSFHMQPWTLASPGMMGQFPAAALIYRRGLVKTGDVVVDLVLALPALFALEGTPLPEGANFDELRARDLPKGNAIAASTLDPLVHFVGRTRVAFGDKPALVATPLAPFVDRSARRVRSSSGEVTLDYGQGILTVRAPAAELASGDLRAAGALSLAVLRVACPLDVAHVALVSLDGRPLATSGRMLLQVMSEERSSGFRSVAVQGRARRVVAAGQDPWQLRRLEGTVSLLRPDAPRLQVVALDHLGVPTARKQRASAIALEPATLYYLIEPAAR